MLLDVYSTALPSNTCLGSSVSLVTSSQSPITRPHDCPPMHMA